MSAATAKKSFLEEMDRPAIQVAPIAVIRYEPSKAELLARIEALEQRVRKLEGLSPNGEAEAEQKGLAAPPSEVVRMVAARFELSVQRLLSVRRDAATAWPRQLAMWLIHKKLRFSSTATGQLFNRDHTTILHAIRMVENRCASYPETDGKARAELAGRVDALILAVKGGRASP